MLTSKRQLIANSLTRFGMNNNLLDKNYQCVLRIIDKFYYILLCILFQYILTPAALLHSMFISKQLKVILCSILYIKTI